MPFVSPPNKPVLILSAIKYSCAKSRNVRTGSFAPGDTGSAEICVSSGIDTNDFRELESGLEKLLVANRLKVGGLALVGTPGASSFFMRIV